MARQQKLLSLNPATYNDNTNRLLIRKLVFWLLVPSSSSSSRCQISSCSCRDVTLLRPQLQGRAKTARLRMGEAWGLCVGLVLRPTQLG